MAPKWIPIWDFKWGKTWSPKAVKMWLKYGLKWHRKCAKKGAKEGLVLRKSRSDRSVFLAIWPSEKCVLLDVSKIVQDCLKSRFRLRFTVSDRLTFAQKLGQVGSYNGS